MRSSVETLPPRGAVRPRPSVRHWKLPRWAKPAAVIGAQLAILATLLWFCLPQGLGGRAGWVLVSGTSMLPSLHTGDLVLVQRQSGYRVGDVVAYRVPKGEPGAGAVVIHRIIGGNGKTGWTMKGDNRTGPDMWHPKNSDVVGEKFLRIPNAFMLLRFFHSPLLLGLLAGFGIFFKILIGGKKKPRAGDGAGT